MKEDILPALTCLRLHSRSLWRRVCQPSGASPDENTVDSWRDSADLRLSRRILGACKSISS